MTPDWRLDHWRPDETDAEHAARVERAEEYARFFTHNACAAIDARLALALSDIDLGDAPRQIRLRAEARAQRDDERRLAWVLHEQTCVEYMEHGDELSEELDRRWTALTMPERYAELWPDSVTEASA